MKKFFFDIVALTISLWAALLFFLIFGMGLFSLIFWGVLNIIETTEIEGTVIILRNIVKITELWATVVTVFFGALFLPIAFFVIRKMFRTIFRFIHSRYL